MGKEAVVKASDSDVDALTFSVAIAIASDYLFSLLPLLGIKIDDSAATTLY